MSLAPDEFPPERLELRLEFLLGRAKAHLADIGTAEVPTQDFLPLACAATLYRDAACVALLLNRIREARDLLQKAGTQFLKLGLPVGATLIALAGNPDAESVLKAHNDLLEGARQQWGPKEARERSDFRRPMIDQASSEPRQLLAMMQADCLWDARRRRDPLVYRRDGPLRMALARNGGHPAGTTGLSIDSYSTVAELLTGSDDFGDDVPEQVAAALSAMMATRAQHLNAARKDSYHWRMLARPAELVDLDAIILMYLATKANGSPKANLESFIYRRGFETPLLDAPMQIASSLRKDQFWGR